MHTHRQIFLDRCLASATALAGAAWVHLKTHPTSFLRFVVRVGYQLIPGGIRNAFCQMMMFDHARDRQVFKHNRSECVYQFPTKLMRNILAPVGYSFVNTSNNLPSSGSFWRTLFFLAQCSLRSCKVFLITTEKARVGNLFSRRECGKFRKVHINTDHSFGYVRLWAKLFLNRKADKPLSSGRTAQRDGLDRSFHHCPTLLGDHGRRDHLRCLG